MQHQATTDASPDEAPAVEGRPQHREVLRNLALKNALRKRAEGVPSYKVPEAAALLSISQEYLYRLIQADGFPAIRMGQGGKPRYVVPAKAIELILEHAAAAGNCVDIAELVAEWHTLIKGGAA
ncbi:MAG: helix-turn-helix domain-containing protein [Actinophytocola sp.]|nr:helix-turn-helix domain-containing protein [Actinophytocola sp.]